MYTFVWHAVHRLHKSSAFGCSSPSSISVRFSFNTCISLPVISTMSLSIIRYGLISKLPILSLTGSKSVHEHIIPNVSTPCFLPQRWSPVKSAKCPKLKVGRIPAFKLHRFISQANVTKLAYPRPVPSASVQLPLSGEIDCSKSWSPTATPLTSTAGANRS